jgi:hypothetical protein
MIVAFGNLESYGKIIESSVDSILVKYTAWNRFTPVTIGREYFERNWKGEGKQARLIKEDSVKILIKCLNLLKLKKNLRISTNELLLNSNITPDGKFLFWIGKDDNDIRWVLIIIFFEILIPPEPFMRDAPHFFYRKYNKNLL